MSYDNTNKGALWRNEKKSSENHPDFTGSADVDGIEYWVAGWKRKEDASPKAPLLKISLKRKDESPKKAVSSGSRGAHSGKAGGDPFADMSDDIPFN